MCVLKYAMPYKYTYMCNCYQLTMKTYFKIFQSFSSMFVWICVCVHAATVHIRNQTTQPLLLFFAFHLLFLVSSSVAQASCSVNWKICLAASHLTIRSLWLQRYAIGPGFYVASEGLNSGPHLSTASTSPHEPHPSKLCWPCVVCV